MVNNRTIGQNETSMAANPLDIAIDDMEIPPGISVVGTTVGILIVAVGTFGNVLIILSVILSKPLCKSTNIFVVSLAACDLFQTLFVKPLYIHTYIFGEWKFGDQVCLYALFASNLAILESILHVEAIAFYRYIFICHPKRASCFHSLRVTLITLCLIYILPTLLVLLPSIPRLRNGDIVFNRKIMFCSFVRHTEFRLAGVLKKVLFLSVAALFLCYCYLRIIHKVRESRKNINEQQGSFTSSRIRREMALLKMVSFTFVTFVVSYLPLSIMYGVDTNRSFPFTAYFVTVILLWLSSSVNWLIYGCVNKQYCTAYRYIICGMLHGTRTIENAGSTFRSVPTDNNTNNGLTVTPSKARRSPRSSLKEAAPPADKRIPHKADPSATTKML